MQPKTLEELKQLGANVLPEGAIGTPVASEDLGKFTFEPRGLSFEMVGGPEHQRNTPIVAYVIPPDATEKAHKQIKSMHDMGLTFGIGAAANARLEGYTGKPVGIADVVLDNPNDTLSYANRIRAERAQTANAADRGAFR